MLDDLNQREAIRAAASSERLLTADALGVDHAAMSWMERSGALRRVLPGVYIGAGHATHPLLEVAAWTLKHPRAVGCLLTAAALHDLTDAFARGTWLFVPFGTSPPRSKVVPIHTVQVTPNLVDPEHDDENGIQHHVVYGQAVRLTGPDRTTLDLWKYPARISQEYALDALRRRLGAPGFEMPKFARLADRLGVWSKIQPIALGLTLR